MGKSMNPYGGFEYNREFSFNQRNFPNQRANSYLWKGTENVDFLEDLGNFINKFNSIKNPRQKFKIEEPDDWTIEQMASAPIQISFLNFLVKLIGAKKILEIGTFVGVTSMYLAEIIPKEGSILTVEKFKKFYDIAKRNIVQNGFENKIKILFGEFLNLVNSKSISPSFDLIYIDGGKELYREYLEKSIELLSDNGLIILDDVFFLGDVINNPPQTAKGKGVLASLEFALEFEGISYTILPVGTGMLMIQKI